MAERFLNILLFSLIIVLTLNLFFPAKNKDTVAIPKTVSLQMEDTSLVVPNIPKISLFNNTTSGVSIQTCENIHLYRNTQKLTDIPASFCQNLILSWGEKKGLPFYEMYKLFSLPWDFIVEYTQTGTAKVAPLTFTVAEQGMFRSFFAHVFYAPIYNLFYGLLVYIPGHSLGWAVIIITFLIRLILLFPQHQMLVNNKKMQLIQPKIKEIQEKYKWDQAKIGMEMLELYKKEKVNPMGSCLPLLIQMPILIGLYWIITSVTDPSNNYYIYSFLYHPDFNFWLISQYFYGLNLQQIGGKIGLLFALAIGLTQWLQAKLSFSYANVTPAPKAEEKKVIEKKEDGSYTSPESFLPDPKMMQNMMLYFLPLMIAVTAFYFPMGVGLYWLIGTVFVIIQQWVVNRMFKK